MATGSRSSSGARRSIDRPVVGRVGHGRDDLVAPHQHRRAVAVAEAGNLDGARICLQQRPPTEAIADRPRADAHDVGGEAQVRVERDDLGDLAASDVHVVGERVGELRRHRADVAADPAEVVEQARPFERKRLEPGRHAGEDSP
jgi:hypothetical protein